MKYLFVFVLSILIFTLSFAQNGSSNLSTTDTVFVSESGKKIKAIMGRMQVKENRKNPNSELISISFIQLKSSTPTSENPLVYLEGGPGSSSTWQATYPEYLESWVELLEYSDVILLDQRGTGQGARRVTHIVSEDVPSKIFVDEKLRQDYFNNVEENALNAFKERGVDLKGYTTLQNAADIEALRIALSYQKISLMGFSYGTHLAQTYMKYYGENVEKAILIGTEGLNHTKKTPLSMDMQFKKIALMAAQKKEVSEKVPNLLELHKIVIEKLNSNPVEMKIISPLTRKPMKIELNGYALNMILRFDIGDASDIPIFPKLLYDASQDNYDILKWFVQKRIGMFYGINGMSMMTDKASGATAYRNEKIKHELEESMFANIFKETESKNDKELNIDLGDEFRSPFASDIPVLFLSGTLDFNTPPYQAEEVRWGFPNSEHIIIKNAGHEQIRRHPKANAAMVSFLKDEKIEDVDLSYPMLEFVPLDDKSKTNIYHPAIAQE
ncbi:alpha/beta fold hydrolase [Bernardetia sp. ABR2-2B]|uniref:alpha/beta hydrolase n=1 Tax=Bernardetia sp. ABR2-2B TaxID=3127472 RepID=UPI0030CA8FFC